MKRRSFASSLILLLGEECVDAVGIEGDGAIDAEGNERGRRPLRNRRGCVWRVPVARFPDVDRVVEDSAQPAKKSREPCGDAAVPLGVGGPELGARRRTSRRRRGRGGFRPRNRGSRRRARRPPSSATTRSSRPSVPTTMSGTCRFVAVRRQGVVRRARRRGPSSDHRPASGSRSNFAVSAVEPIRGLPKASSERVPIP